MGVDLSCMPIQYGDLKDNKWWLGYTRLSFDRNYDLFANFDGFTRTDKKSKIVGQLIPRDVKVQIYKDEGCEEVTEDAYGSKLTYCLAGDFKKIKIKRNGDWNKAIIKFLQTIPKETPIVLYWH